MMRTLSDFSEVFFLEEYEATSLSKEIEEAFCLLDTSIQGECYSGTKMELEYPMLARLYKSTRNRK